MKKFFLFTLDLLSLFIISPSQLDELRYKRKFVFFLEIRFFHPLLLCLRTLSVSKFFESIISSSGRFPKFLMNPPKYPILLFVGKTLC